MRKDVREFIRGLEAAGLTVDPLRKQNEMPFTLPLSPDTIRWHKAALVELRKLGLHL